MGTEKEFLKSIREVHVDAIAAKINFGNGAQKIREWIEGNDGVVLGANREDPLIVLKLKDWLKLL